MMGRRKTLYASFVLIVVVALASGVAHAALGERVSSVETDRQALSAVQGASVAHRHYTVHEIRTDATVVREYVSPDGIVFAIAWNGLVHPDLTALLGTYAGEYEEALRSTPREHGRRQLRVKSTRVVVEKWGHIRNLKGRAYDPALIPPGVSIDDIK